MKRTKRVCIVLSLCIIGIILAAYFIEFINDRYGSVGLASWYGNEWRGKETASGEIYNPDKLTAAHRILSFGTLVKVTNLSNNRQVKVKVNDRGPYRRGRIIDLSLAAARKLGIIEDGVAKVKLKIVSE